MFTKRHYQTLAIVMRQANELAYDFGWEANSGRCDSEFARGFAAANDYIIGRLANVFSADNYAFDRDKFTQSCSKGG